jgi:membrane-associated phospholipid phosphatase
MQDEHSFMHYFMEYFGELGEAPGIIITSLIVVMIGPYSESCFYVTIVGATMYINGGLKLLFHDPRPFWNTSDIEALNCSYSYGNPSGHAMYFTAAVPILYFLLFKKAFKVSL